MTGPARDDAPLWLLDIDGVVNALAYGPVPTTWPQDEWVQRIVVAEIPDRGTLTLPILAARPVLDFVRAVHESGRAEIRWHSTWRTAAVSALSPALGLPTTIPISIAPEWTHRPAELWWKQPAAERALARGRPLVWTDDEIDAYADTIGSLHTEHSLLIAPESAYGLRPEHLDLISAFLDRWSAA